MDLLFVTQVVLDRPHGGPRHVHAVARAWSAAGHRVRLLAPGEDEAVCGVERLRLRPGLGPGVRLELALAGAVLADSAVGGSRRPDVAYVRLSASSLFVPVALAARRIPFVAELNGRLLAELEALGRPGLAVQTVGLAQRLVSQLAYATVAVDEKIGRHAREALGARDVRVIENGADLDVAVPGDRLAARGQLGLPVDRPLLAFAGTLAPELRLDLLLEAVNLLPGSPLLVVAGDGPARGKLEGADRSRVRVLGPLPHPDAIRLLQAADVCVNVRDGDLGMKALEYAAVGRRFVAFRVEGSQRLARLYPDHRAAFLVEDRTAAGLAAALGAALDEEAEGPLPPDAVSKARAGIGWDRTAARVAEVLEEARRSSPNVTGA